MQLLDDMDRDEERVLVTAALTDKAARAKLRKLSRALVGRLAALYRKEGVTVSPKRMTDAAMRQFDAVLNDYGNRIAGHRKSAEPFSFYFAWWSTRRLEQMLRG